MIDDAELDEVLNRALPHVDKIQGAISLFGQHVIDDDLTAIR